MKNSLMFLAGALITASGYSQSIQPAWLDRFNDPSNGYEDAGAICTDGAGNCYVGGMSPTLSGASSFIVVKYGPNGNRLWTARPGNAFGFARALAVDGDSNVYASGYRWGGPSYQEFLVKFNANGQELWTRPLSSPAARLLPDDSGNLYVVGHYSDGYDSDWSTMKIAPNGKLIWEIRYDDPAGRNDEIANAMFDPDGNLVVAGTVNTSNNLTPGDVSVAKYSPLGFVIWQRFHSVGTTTHDFADDFGIDKSGNITLIGGTAANASVYETASDLWLKYSPMGKLIGSSVGGQAPNDNVGQGVVDSAGNLYHVTFSRLTKFSPGGSLLWRYTFASPTLGITIPSVNLNLNEQVIVAGTSWEGTFNGDFLTFAFSLDGTPRWSHRYNGPINGDDTVAGLAVDTSGAAFVTGTSWNQYSSIGGTADDIVTLKFNYYNGPN